MMSPSKSKTTACNVNSAPNYPEAMGSTSKDSRRWVPHAEPIASGSRVRNLLPRVGVGSGPVGEGGDTAGDGGLAGLDVDRVAVAGGGVGGYRAVAGDGRPHRYRTEHLPEMSNRGGLPESRNDSTGRRCPSLRCREEPKT